jgi:MOSC domain-containing protein YiiM
MIEIFSIVYKPDSLPSKPSDHYTRVPLEAAVLVANYGIEGDQKGGHPERQINIMTREVLQNLSGEGFNIQPGQMGEQIVISGFDLNTLAVGERIQLGDEACVEVTSYRTGCDRFEALQGKPRGDAKDRLGVMAKVVAGGAIKIGDTVKILQNV